jgi:hypothetical protein
MYVGFGPLTKNMGGGKTLNAIIVILIVMWLLGVVTSYTLGGLIHLLLVITVIAFLVNVIARRRIL